MRSGRGTGFERLGRSPADHGWMMVRSPPPCMRRAAGAPREAEALGVTQPAASARSADRRHPSTSTGSVHAWPDADETARPSDAHRVRCVG